MYEEQCVDTLARKKTNTQFEACGSHRLELLKLALGEREFALGGGLESSTRNRLQKLYKAAKKRLGSYTVNALW